MMKKILKVVCLYVLFIFVETLSFSAILFFYRIDVNIGFEQFVISKLCGKSLVTESWGVAAIELLYGLINVTAVAFLTSYIVAYTSHRNIKLILPDKLVIRHKTSKGSPLTLGVLIGNKSESIYNSRCAITFTYLVKPDYVFRNSEKTLYAEQIWIQNYYRFSFDLEDFPVEILQDIIDKPDRIEKERITVTVSGSANEIGEFIITKGYKLSDIVFDEHVPQIESEIKNPFTGNVIKDKKTGKTKLKYLWDEVTRIVEVGEDKRQKTVREIKNIIRRKT